MSSYDGGLVVGYSFAIVLQSIMGYNVELREYTGYRASPIYRLAYGETHVAVGFYVLWNTPVVQSGLADKSINAPQTLDLPYQTGIFISTSALTQYPSYNLDYWRSLLDPTVIRTILPPSGTVAGSPTLCPNAASGCGNTPGRFIPPNCLLPGAVCAEVLKADPYLDSRAVERMILGLGLNLTVAYVPRVVMRAAIDAAVNGSRPILFVETTPLLLLAQIPKAFTRIAFPFDTANCVNAGTSANPPYTSPITCDAPSQGMGIIVTGKSSSVDQYITALATNLLYVPQMVIFDSLVRGGAISTNASANTAAVAAACGVLNAAGVSAVIRTWIPTPPARYCPEPILTPGTGSTSHDPIIVEVTLTAPLAAAVIYYTLDGSVPSANSTIYYSPIRFADLGAHHIRVIVMAPLWEPSTVNEGLYTVTRVTKDKTLTVVLAVVLAFAGLLVVAAVVVWYLLVYRKANPAWLVDYKSLHFGRDIGAGASSVISVCEFRGLNIAAKRFRLKRKASTTATPVSDPPSTATNTVTATNTEHQESAWSGSEAASCWDEEAMCAAGAGAGAGGSAGGGAAVGAVLAPGDEASMWLNGCALALLGGGNATGPAAVSAASYSSASSSFLSEQGERNSVAPARASSRLASNGNRVVDSLGDTSFARAIGGGSTSDMASRTGLGVDSLGRSLHGRSYGSGRSSTQPWSSDRLSDTFLVSQMRTKKAAVTQNKKLKLLRKMFMNEVAVISELRHPHVVLFMGAAISPSEFVILTELLDRGSLFDVIHNATLAMPWRFRAQLLVDAAAGLQYLHLLSPPLLHKDVKSLNFLVSTDWRVKVCDFGVSSIRSEGGVVGTVQWLAPEVISEGHYSTASDMYAFGIVLWEVVSRREPFDSVAFDDILAAVLDANAQWPCPRDTPAELTELIRELTAADPMARPLCPEVYSRLLRVHARLPAEDAASDSSPKSEHADHAALCAAVYGPGITLSSELAPVAYDSVSVLFADVVGFSTMAGQMEPVKLREMLRRLHRKFDRIARRRGVVTVETVGESYMAIAGLNRVPAEVHAYAVGRMALDMLEAAGRTLVDESRPRLGFVTVRVGIDSGPVSGSVAGSGDARKLTFVGDTVNIASRMERSGDISRAVISERTRAALTGTSIASKERAAKIIKGRGVMRSFVLIPPRAETDEDKYDAWSLSEEAQDACGGSGDGSGERMNRSGSGRLQGSGKRSGGSGSDGSSQRRGADGSLSHSNSGLRGHDVPPSPTGRDGSAPAGMRMPRSMSRGGESPVPRSPHGRSPFGSGGGREPSTRRTGESTSSLSDDQQPQRFQAAAAAAAVATAANPQPASARSTHRKDSIGGRSVAASPRKRESINRDSLTGLRESPNASKRDNVTALRSDGLGRSGSGSDGRATPLNGSNPNAKASSPTPNASQDGWGSVASEPAVAYPAAATSKFGSLLGNLVD